jgi:hypothetical protein
VWTSYEKLRTVIEKKMFSNTEELLPVISFNAKASADEAKKHEDFVTRMVAKGYTPKQVRLLCEWYLRVRKFQEDEQASVFLISLKAGGSGLNLTAASYVILYDPWWNPAVENQAIDRAHRIGQTQPVIAYRLISRSSIEEKILMLQQKKKMLAGDVLGEESFAQNLERDDFEFLLGLEERAGSKVRIEEETWG